MLVSFLMSCNCSLVAISVVICSELIDSCLNVAMVVVTFSFSASVGMLLHV